MDSLIAACARALAAGDVLGALKHVALRHDPPALALRGIAMAQLGELQPARSLLRRAARGFGRHETLAHARCTVAEAEVALALRDLGGTPHALLDAAQVLQARGDHANATQARLMATRRLLLLGRLQEASALLATTSNHQLATPALVALIGLAQAEIAVRAVRSAPARSALGRAQAAARQAGLPALVAEVADALALLDRPVARLWRPGAEGNTALRLAEVETLLGSDTLVVDACRRGLRHASAWCGLTRRPVLFTLARVLAEGWPAPVDRDALILRAFRQRRPDDTHRARLRVQLGRLRALLAPLARLEPTAHGFQLLPHASQGVALLLPPIEGNAASLQALLADGAAWSTSALALALGESQRNVQRALVALQAAGQVRSLGQARALRWLALPMGGQAAGFTTSLLLPAALPFA
jgi:hypothetical protein